MEAYKTQFYKKFQDVFEELEMVEKLSGNFKLTCKNAQYEGGRALVIIKIDGTSKNMLEIIDYSDSGYIKVFLTGDRLINGLKGRKLQTRPKRSGKFVNVSVGEFKNFFLESVVGYGGAALESAII
jgi:hypothetical protein